MTNTLPHDGERVVEATYSTTDEGRNILAMHLASYRRVVELCAGKDVLDLGCGSGYGIGSLASVTKSATGVDVSAPAIAYANECYRAGNLRFQTIEANRPTPFSAESFDVVLSFQVIEHVPDDRAYVAEIRRLLRPGGLAVFITPDRRTRLFSFQKPWNRWHLREYSAESLSALVSTSLRITTSEVMQGSPEPVAAELKRYRVTRWLTLPFTLPFASERLRVAGLALLSRLATAFQHRRAGIGVEDSPNDDYWFESGTAPGLNVLVVAEKA